MKIKILLISAVLSLAGCETSQQTIAMQTVDTTDAGVRLAMTGWGFYVSAKHPSTNVENQVLTAWHAVKNAELVTIDATEAVATNSANTNALITASIIQSNATYYLVTTIKTLTNN